MTDVEKTKYYQRAKRALGDENKSIKTTKKDVECAVNKSKGESTNILWMKSYLIHYLKVFATTSSINSVSLLSSYAHHVSFSTCYKQNQPLH